MTKYDVSVGRRTIKISNPDKVLFPRSGHTKRDLAEYYKRVAGIMLPHVRDRAVMLQRFPDGIEGPSFYQKNVADQFPDWIPRTRVRKEGGHLEQLVIRDAATLVFLADQACITPHVWLSRVDRPDKPDRMIFDLDPSDGAFDAVRDAAHTIRELLEEVGLPTFVMTTGSRGLHVLVPLNRSTDFDSVRAFARDVADAVARSDPKRFTTEQRKQKRRGRVYIDTMRNARAQTTVAPYAVRAREGAPVATPLEWREVDRHDMRADRYTIDNLFRRLAAKSDPWASLAGTARSLTSPRERLDKLLSKD